MIKAIIIYYQLETDFKRIVEKLGEVSCRIDFFVFITANRNIFIAIRVCFSSFLDTEMALENLADVLLIKRVHKRKRTCHHSAQCLELDLALAQADERL